MDRVHLLQTFINWRIFKTACRQMKFSVPFQREVKPFNCWSLMANQGGYYWFQVTLGEVQSRPERWDIPSTPNLNLSGCRRGLGYARTAGIAASDSRWGKNKGLWRMIIAQTSSRLIPFSFNELENLLAVSNKFLNDHLNGSSPAFQWTMASLLEKSGSYPPSVPKHY